MIRRSHTRDNPSDRAAFNVSGSFGTRAADTILAAVDLAASTDRTYDRTRPGTLTQKSSCRQGAVHIRGPEDDDAPLEWRAPSDDTIPNDRYVL